MESDTATDAPVKLSTALPEVDADSIEPEPVANINDGGESLEDILDAASAQVAQPMDVLPTGNIENQDPKTNVTQNTATEVPKEAATFNLGVPGLKFSTNNVKTAKDGTKMVQIHQSQITPDQLQALQNNPNIKVVFRHVPSGKSYTKPPRHLLPPGYSSPIKKRKAYFTEEELEGSDVYNFDEGDDLQGPAKRTKYNDLRAKYMHGYGGVTKKRGRPRIGQETGNYQMNYSRSNIPAKVMLTDLLARVNSPNAKREVKLHTSQINAEVLANMELNPMYKIILTTKQELPPLVIENVNAEEQAKLELDAKETENQEKENVEEKESPKDEEQGTEETGQNSEEMEQDQEEQEKQPEKEEEEEEESKRLEEEEAARQKKLAEEEEELKRSVASPQLSRSGRIRKPSRFSLDIARLTKRKSAVSGGDSSAEDGEHESKSKQKAQTVVSPSRGKAKKEEEEKRRREEEAKKKEEEEKRKKEEEIKKKEEEERKRKEEEEKRQKEEEEKQKKEEEAAAKEKREEEESKKLDENATQEKTSESETNLENQEKNDDPVTAGDHEKTGPAEPDASTNPDKVSTNVEKKADDTMEIDEPFSLKLTEEEEEKEVIDNKFRLRKLLEQCSTEEIRSVLLPEAFDSINIGDFLLYKSGQMHNSSGKVSFPQLYMQFEKLHKDASNEALRYNTLVRRANKVGGEKRMEKIVLMPVYNIDAANSLEISNSSIDAHICGIQRTITTEMIAANSFFIKSKMDSPAIRLNFPEITVRKNNKPKEKRQLYTNQHQQPFANSQQPEPDSTTPDKPKQAKRASYGQKIATMKYNTLQTKSQMTTQVRRPTYIEQLKSTGQITLGGQNHQIATKTQENLLQSIPVDTSLLRSDVQSSQMAATATAALAQLQATADQQQAVVSTTNNVLDANPIGQVLGTAETTLVSSASDTSGQTEQFFVTEDGVPVATTSTDDGEVRKQLVPIGDGQYVELPEGYSLIQTSEGYIIGQPGSTFTQGEDGNVYITNSDGTTTEITQQDVSGEADNPNIIDAVTEG